MFHGDEHNQREAQPSYDVVLGDITSAVRTSHQRGNDPGRG